MTELKSTERTVNDIVNKVSQEFGINQIPNRGTMQFERIIRLFGGLDRLTGKRILDLGCGSTLTVDKSPLSPADSQRDYEPWLCRLLAEAGADVVGIDIHNLDSESFEHHTGDLTKEEAFEFLPDDSVDVINSVSLLGRCPSPLLFERDDFEQITLENIHLLQAMRLLKEGGVYLYDMLAVYRKEQGRLVRYKDIFSLKTV